MLISTLIEAQDARELVGDKLAEILLAELANQQSLAVAAGKSPEPYRMRVFRERSDPWQGWIDAPGTDEYPDEGDEYGGARPGSPIVDVSYADGTFDEAGSDVVEHQKAVYLFHVDVFGYGVACDDGGAGHAPAHVAARRERDRAVRLVRQILMSAHHIDLDSPGLVWRRWLRGIETITLRRPEDGRALQHICGARLTFEITVSEHSPQHIPVPITAVNVQLKHSPNGQVVLDATFDVG